MSRKVVLDRKQVICRNAAPLRMIVKPGMWVTFNNAGKMCNSSSGRVIGRIADIENDGLENCRGWLCVAALSHDSSFFMERWVKPEWVFESRTMPAIIRWTFPKEPNKTLDAFRATL